MVQLKLSPEIRDLLEPKGIRHPVKMQRAKNRNLADSKNRVDFWTTIP